MTFLIVTVIFRPGVTKNLNDCPESDYSTLVLAEDWCSAERMMKLPFIAADLIKVT